MDSFLLDETDCSGKFLRYFARLYISPCLYVIEHSFVFRNIFTSYNWVEIYALKDSSRHFQLCFEASTMRVVFISKYNAIQSVEYMSD